MLSSREEPRILVVTPEVSFLPDRSGEPSESGCARAGGLGDVSASLIQALLEQGADVHVAIPNYRRIFRANAKYQNETGNGARLPEINDARIHLVQDRSFFYLPKLFADRGWEAVKTSLVFQREVINHIVPIVQPDLIQCYDWMTGLIPAMARSYGIPCLFTLYNIDTVKLNLAVAEDYGIDAASFWQHCYFTRMPVCYEETRESNPADFLVSAVFAAHYVNTLSPAFSQQILDVACEFVEPALKSELHNKQRAGCLTAIQQAPPPHFNPANDDTLFRRYGPETHSAAKLFNKLRLQEKLKLRMISGAPLFFWPTRLGRSRRGFQLMIELLPAMLSDYASQGLQVVFVADGDLHADLRLLAGRLNAADRVAVSGFDPLVFRLAFAAADFVLMPMQYEPCGLGCKLGQRYGALPIGHDTGGIHDSLTHLEPAGGRGNGFVFDAFNTEGLRRAVGQAMAFWALPESVRAQNVSRIMAESLVRDSHETMARAYIRLYEQMLQRPFGCLNYGSRQSEARPMQAAA